MATVGLEPIEKAPFSNFGHRNEQLNLFVGLFLHLVCFKCTQRDNRDFIEVRPCAMI